MEKRENKPMREKNPGFTLWFTGLPCSGKSTLAQLVATELAQRGRGVEILDGDVVRTNLTKGLGFSKEDRDENIRRIGFVCRLLSRHGAVAIAAAISPYREIRDEVRAGIKNFVEVYVNTPLELCIERDVKGMYKKALAGQMKDFTGVDAPYEAPVNPEVLIETQKETPQQSAERILRYLEERGFVQPSHEPAYTAEEAEKIHERLVRLGYIDQ
jgi:adenylyl-sulfate kinase